MKNGLRIIIFSFIEDTGLLLPFISKPIYVCSFERLWYLRRLFFWIMIKGVSGHCKEYYHSKNELLHSGTYNLINNSIINLKKYQNVMTVKLYTEGKKFSNLL